MTKRAFSLAEIIIVLAILVTVAAITYPVFSRARDASKRAICISNLRQLGLAIQLYRDAMDGTDSAAPTWNMGLPVWGIDVVKVLGKSYETTMNLECPLHRSYPEGKVAQTNYYQMWPVLGLTKDGEIEQKEWIAYVESTGDQAVLFADPYHVDSWPATRLSLNHALAFTLSGSIRMKNARGEPRGLDFWKTP